jgi:hypothetical protein
MKSVVLKYSKLMAINIAVLLLVAIISFGALEAYLAFGDTTGNAGVIKTLKRDGDNGWEAIHEIGKIGSGDDAIIFVGDSFTQGARWPVNVVNNLKSRGKSVVGYSLGVAGYGTIQELVKLNKYISELKPKIVVLLFFAWNDVRDNYQYPAIYYNEQTRNRPFYDLTSTSSVIKSSFIWPDWLMKSRVYRKYFFPLIVQRDERILGSLSIDEISRRRIPVFASYGDKRTWDPFYRVAKQNSHYVEQSWLVTEAALKEMRRIVEQNNARLIVVGIDNAFTVDDDVEDQWVPDRADFDRALPLKRLGVILSNLDVSYINALPSLRELKVKVGKKVYNGPIGNLSGHFEIEAEDQVGILVSDYIYNNRFIR